MQVEITRDPPEVDHDGDDDDGSEPAFNITAGIFAPHAAFNASVVLPAEGCTVPMVVGALTGAARGVTAAFNPMALEVLNALLVDSARDAGVWVMPEAGMASADAPAHLTLHTLAETAKQHRRVNGRELAAVRFMPGDQLVPIEAVRAVLMAARAW